MTVKQLIEALQGLDQDAEVRFQYNPDDGLGHVEPPILGAKVEEKLVLLYEIEE